MIYDGQCGSCVHFQDVQGKPYNEKNDSSIVGLCTLFGTYYRPNNKCESNYSSGRSTGCCYLTTMICHILGYGDHCGVLETLRNFRNDVLQQDPQYADILYEYDTVGPQIAKKLEEEDKDFVLDLYNGFILPIVSDIQEKRNNLAISRYIVMTKALEDCYGIEFSKKAPDTYDYHNGGHGVCKKKTIN